MQLRGVSVCFLLGAWPLLLKMPSRKAYFVSYQGSMTATASSGEADSVSGECYFVSVVCIPGVHGRNDSMKIAEIIKLIKRQNSAQKYSKKNGTE